MKINILSNCIAFVLLIISIRYVAKMINLSISNSRQDIMLLLVIMVFYGVLEYIIRQLLIRLINRKKDN